MSILLWVLVALLLLVLVIGVVRFGTVPCPHCGRRVLRPFIMCAYCGKPLR